MRPQVHPESAHMHNAAGGSGRESAAILSVERIVSEFSNDLNGVVGHVNYYHSNESGECVGI